MSLNTHTRFIYSNTHLPTPPPPPLLRRNNSTRNQSPTQGIAINNTTDYEHEESDNEHDDSTEEYNAADESDSDESYSVADTTSSNSTCIDYTDTYLDNVSTTGTDTSFETEFDDINQYRTPIILSSAFLQKFINPNEIYGPTTYKIIKEWIKINTTHNDYKKMVNACNMIKDKQPINYFVQNGNDANYTCSCPSFKYCKVVHPEPRTCKHVYYTLFNEMCKNPPIETKNKTKLKHEGLW